MQRKPTRKERKKVVKAAAKKIKAEERGYIKARLAKMDLLEFFERRYREAREHLELTKAYELATFDVNRRIIQSMNLPASKKKILERLLTDHLLALKSQSGLPIARKTALRLLDQFMKSLRLQVAERHKPEYTQVSNVKGVMELIKKAREQSEHGKTEKVSIHPGVAGAIADSYSILIERTAGRKNARLVHAAHGQLAPSLLKIIREKHMGE